MGEWGEPVRSFLDGEAVDSPGDFQVLMGSDIEQWHPVQASNVSGDESTDRQHMRRGDAKRIGTDFEEAAAQDYGGEKVDKGASDIIIGLNGRAYGWPVQVKSAALYRKDESSDSGINYRRGAFKLRWDNYSNLPEESLLDLNVYNPVFESQGNGFETFRIQQPKDENEEESRNIDELYVEVHGKMLVPKQLLEKEIDANLSNPPREPDSAWYRNGQYELGWNEVFGEKPQESPIYRAIRRKNLEEKGLQPSHDITNY